MEKTPALLSLYSAKYIVAHGGHGGAGQGAHGGAIPLKPISISKSEEIIVHDHPKGINECLMVHMGKIGEILVEIISK